MAIKFIQDAVANSTGGTTTLAITISPAQFNTLVVQSGVAGAQTITGITDNTGLNTYTKAAGVTNTVTAEVWTATNISPGVTTVTVTYSATSAGNAVVVSEYSGVRAIGTNNTNTGAGSTPETITVTTTGAFSYIVASLANNLGSTEAVTANTGTLRDHTASGAGVNTVQTAAVDNTATTLDVVVDAANLGSGVNWAAAAVELLAITAGMNTTLLVTGSTIPQAAAGVTYFLSIGQTVGQINIDPISSPVSRKWRSPGVFSRLYVRISANTFTQTAVFSFTKNAVGGNQTVSVPTTVTGEFQDNSHSDSVVSGDLVCMQNNMIVGTGSLTYPILALLFSGATNPTDETLAFAGRTGAFNQSAVTRFVPIAGSDSGSGSAIGTGTEANAQFKMKIAGTLSNLEVFVASNARTGATVFNVRIGAANGNNTISVGAGLTGLFEDTTHTDAISINSLINYSVVLDTETNALGCSFISVKYAASAYHYIVADAGTTNTLAAGPVTYWNSISGDSNGIASASWNSTSETTVMCLAQFPHTLSNLETFVSQSSTLTSASTLTIRKNAANGNQVISIPAATTGYFEDTVNTDVLIGSEEINYQLVVGGVATGGRHMTVNSVGILASGINNVTPNSGTANTHLLPITGIGT